MGFENRDYYREDEGNNNFSMGSPLSVTLRLIIICSGLFLIDLFFFPDHQKLANTILALHSDTYAKPWLWFEYLTYGFTHRPVPIGHILWNMVALFFFGSEMERLYGSREYLRFYLVTILLGGLVWSIRIAMRHEAGIVIGSDGVVTAVTLLFCLHFPFRNIMIFGVLPVPAWVIGGLIILGNVSVLWGEFFAGAGIAADPSIAGMVFAIIYFRWGGNLSVIPGFEAIFNLPAMLRSLFRSRPKLRVYSEANDDNAYHELEEQADRILSKLHREGESSLSPQERKLLERYSRLMRQKHR